jgi:thiosulfate dehydrogenase [quinone] large subunit
MRNPSEIVDDGTRMSSMIPASAVLQAGRGIQPWRDQAFGVLRIVFGIVWAIDAQFKWRPPFQTGFPSLLSGALDGQPPLVKAWIGFWINIIEVNPHVFATIVALSESALAFALIFGIFTNMAALGGVLLTLTIWSTAEGFGGPYKEGSTDIGTAIIYAFVFVALFLAQAGLQFGADRFLTPLLGRWGWLASGRIMPSGRPAAR